MNVGSSSSAISKPYLVQVLESLCPNYGARLFVEPRYGYVGYIIFPAEGKKPERRYFFTGSSFDINGHGASSVTKDKFYCSRFLTNEGIQVPREVLVHSPRNREELRIRHKAISQTLTSYGAAHDFADAHGFPLYVKPNEGSQGKDVHRVDTRTQMCAVITELFREHPRILVQAPVSGNDYRIVVFGDEVIAAYQRLALHVTGDGKRTIQHLIDERLGELQQTSPGEKIAVDDPRIDTALNRAGFSRYTTPSSGETVELLANANLSTGGSAIDITESLSGDLQNVAVRSTRAMGLAFAGVDILCADATKPSPDYTVLEVNSAPGLTNYAQLGIEQDARARLLYDRILKTLSQR